MATVLRILEQTHIAAARLDAKSCVVEANSSFAAILGAPPGSLRGAMPDALLAGASSETSSTGPATAYRIVRNGIPIWVRLDLTKHGRSRIAILTDVTSEHLALEALRHAYAVRDKLLHDGKIGTWRYDPNADVYQFSDELSLGHEGIGAPVPTGVLQLIQHPDDQQCDTEIRERITREGGTANAEMRYREADESWTHLNVHYRAGHRTPSGRYEMFGISQNITAVAKARDDAHTISQRLKIALKAAQAGVFGYNYADKTFWTSPELEELIGKALLDRMSSDPIAYFVPEDREAAGQFLGGVSRASHAPSIDVRLQRDEGYRWVRLYYDVNKRDAAGEPLDGVGLLIDIDERKRQEIALAEARRAAEFANRTKTEFLANMSHELRTPLNAILGFSEMIAKAMFGPIGPKYLEYARDVHKSGEHLLALVNDVLDLAKLEAGKLELRESEIDLSTLIDDCVMLLRDRAEDGRVVLQSHSTPDLPLLRADERSVRQVLLNFLSNAVKFTPEGGHVAVSASCDARGALCLTVRDTGIGMSAADIAVALSPFGQVDSKLARKHQGTGLGLPICKSLLEVHGGEISVTSVPNKGTTLTALFPPVRTIRRTAAARA